MNLQLDYALAGGPTVSFGCGCVTVLFCVAFLGSILWYFFTLTAAMFPYGP